MSLYPEPTVTQSRDFDEFVRITNSFAHAIRSNDASEIASFLAPDWVLVTPEAGPVARQQFLRAIGGGRLRHDTIEIDVECVKVYGDTAVVTGRGSNIGAFEGRPIRADEWTTDVYLRVEGRWYCVLTQLTPIAPSKEEAAAC